MKPYGATKTKTHFYANGNGGGYSETNKRDCMCCNGDFARFDGRNKYDKKLKKRERRKARKEISEYA